MIEPVKALAALRRWLGAAQPVAVAVSGGVDSMTLAVVAHRELQSRARMFHAVSAAVPVDATERVKRYAADEGWALALIDAGELGDGRYLSNPANRCYFCKTDLYGTMVGRTEALLVSGTNVDDLGDFRPGLEAAREHGVRHPYVETGLDKSSVRALAHHLELRDLAELPAAPCLSSRIETGIAIMPEVLRAVDWTEKLVVRTLRPRTVRCRVRRAGVVIELDPGTLAGAGDDVRARLGERIAARFRRLGIERPVGFDAYRMGSAFLRPEGNG